MATGRLRSFTATMVLVALVWIFVAPQARAEAVASWGGRVFQGDRVSPRQGVVVSLVDDRAGRTLHTEPTRADGAFTIEGEPGTYKLRVETPEGVFVSPEPVELAAGVNRPMALALDAEKDHGLGNAEVSRTTEYVFAGIVLLFALLVFLEITDDASESRASIS